MNRRAWGRSYFDAADDEPLASMSNLVDIMLVFACGLIAALAAQQQAPTPSSGGQEVVEGSEIPELPAGIGGPGVGYQAVGRVYRDPESGKMLLIGPSDDD